MLNVWTRRRRHRRDPTPPGPEARPRVVLRIRPNDGQALDYVGRVHAAIRERLQTT